MVQSIMRAVVKHVCVSMSKQRDRTRVHSQYVKAPAMIQLAHEVGKRKWPSCVNGYDNAANRSGGITNRNLARSQSQSKRDHQTSTHGSIGR